jgi:ketosteroid isomerase-like protein
MNGRDLLIVTSLLATTIGCSSTKSKLTIDPIDAYATAAAKEKSGSALGEQERIQAIKRWQSLLGDLSTENVQGKVDAVYSADAFFNDTLKTLLGAAAIEDYLVETAELLDYGRVAFEDVAISGEDVYVRWRMVYRSKVLSKKQDIVTIGMTHLRFNRDGKVSLHQDFWDSTRGIFEHVPIVGAGIRMVKKRL